MTERYGIQVVTRIQSGDGATELALQDGVRATVPAAHPDRELLLQGARWSVRTGRPVGLVLDEQGTVVDLSWAWDSSVNQVRDDPEDNSRLEVWFWAFSPVCYLTRDHPEFNRIRRTLAEAAEKGGMVWVANRSHMIEGETETWHKLMDVRPISAVALTPRSASATDAARAADGKRDGAATAAEVPNGVPADGSA